MNSGIMVIVILLLCCWLDIGESCLCSPMEYNVSISKAHFAIKAKILSARYTKQENDTSSIFKGIDGLNVPFYAFYDVSVMKVFKGNILQKQSTFATVQTPYSNAQCGIRLNRGVTYLLTGKIFIGQMQIQLCDWIEPYHEVTQKNKLLLASKSNHVGDLIVVTDYESLKAGHDNSASGNCLSIVLALVIWTVMLVQVTSGHSLL